MTTVEETVDSHSAGKNATLETDVISGRKLAPLFYDEEPCTKARGFAALGVAVSNKATSREWYEKIGFDHIADKSTDEVLVMKNRGGLELHIMQCDKGLEEEEGKNLLMDFPTNKYPGHTHVAFTVPNVERTRQYLESSGIPISGERKPPGKSLFALFARDPDRTTFEFERNDGEADDVVITRDVIGYPQCMDHVGIRVNRPEDALVWYAKTLGFTRLVNKYEPNPDILKNFAPWISRTDFQCDINLIINGTENPSENILIAKGCVRPGLVFFTVFVDDCMAAADKLRQIGVNVATEAELPSHGKWGCLAQKILPTPGGKSVFLEDEDFNIIRLVNAE